MCAKMLGKSIFKQVKSSKLTTRFHTNYPKKGILTMKRAETHQLNKVINLVSPIVRQTNIVCPNAIFWEIYTHTS